MHTINNNILRKLECKYVVYCVLEKLPVLGPVLYTQYSANEKYHTERKRYVDIGMNWSLWTTLKMCGNKWFSSVDTHMPMYMTSYETILESSATPV